jgi:hypothetical protein
LLLAISQQPIANGQKLTANSQNKTPSQNIFSILVVRIKKKSIFADRLKVYFNVKNKSI